MKLKLPTNSQWNWKPNANAIIQALNAEARATVDYYNAMRTNKTSYVHLLDFEQMLGSLPQRLSLYDYIHPNAPATFLLIDALLNALIMHYEVQS